MGDPDSHPEPPLDPRMSSLIDFWKYMRWYVCGLYFGEGGVNSVLNSVIMESLSVSFSLVMSRFWTI